MQQARRKDELLIHEGNCDKEFGSIKKLMVEQKRIKTKIEKIAEKDHERVEVKKEKLRDLENRKKLQKKNVIQDLKHNFKHIDGMFIKTAKFKNDKERMESWQTDLVIQRKILRPSKRLIVCKQGVDNIK